MTKKMLHTVDGDGRKEFLIPYRVNNRLEFLGITSGKTYHRAMIVFTGREMTSSILADRVRSIGMKPESELYELLLVQISNFKISKKVIIDRDYKQLTLTYDD